MEIQLVNPIPELKYILCYPSFDEVVFRKRLAEAFMLGLRSIILEGNTEIKGFKVLGKGTTSIVVKGIYYDGKILTTKIRRTDSNRSSVIREAKLLSLANESGVGPRIVSFSRNFLLWEFIDGISLLDFIGLVNKNIRVVGKVLLDLIAQLYRLDLKGITHKELSKPKNHILVTRGLKVFIIDFETASMISGKSNLTQVMSFLFFDKNKASYTLRNLLRINAEDLRKLREMLKIYKHDRKAYGDIINFLRQKIGT